MDRGAVAPPRLRTASVTRSDAPGRTVRGKTETAISTRSGRRALELAGVAASKTTSAKRAMARSERTTPSRACRFGRIVSKVLGLGKEYRDAERLVGDGGGLARQRN